MTLTLRKIFPAPDIESGQSEAVVNAGGPRLWGDFMWTEEGWELRLRRLTFHELIEILELARRIVE